MRLIALLSLAAAPLAAQKVLPIRLIDAPNARTPASLGAPAAVRELPDGRLLVNDTQRRQLLLFERSLTTSTIVADSAAGTPNSYGAKAGGIVPFLADSTLFVDPDGLSMFVLDPRGKIARVASVPRSQDAAALASNGASLDAKGRLVYRGLTRVKQVTNGGMTTAQFPDSIDIDRIDLATRRVDTAGYFKVMKQNMTITQTERGMTVGGEINPLQNVDDWAVLSDGAIAIVRGLDYHIDIVNPDGSLTSARKIPFTWRPLTDEDKTAVLDSAKKQLDRMMAGGPAAAMAMHGGGAPPATQGHDSDASANKANNSPPPVRLVSASALPDYWPAFSQGAAKADVDGRLWIRTSATRPGAIGGPIYDVVDRTGSLVDRIQIPAGRQIVGFGKGGVVYMTAREATGAWIERTSTNASSSTTIATTDTTTQKLVGVWEGTYRSDHASGAMTMTIARDTSWKVTMEFVAGDQVVPTRVTNFKVEGNTVSWKQELMNQPCASTMTLDAAAAVMTMKGGVACGQIELAVSLKKR